MDEESEIKVFAFIPKKYVPEVDRLLKEVESNHRIKDDTSLSEESKEKYDSKKDVVKYIVALDKDTVIGQVIVYKRNIVFKDKEVVLGGIGGVGTKEEYRGKGIASRMVETASEVLKELGCDVVYLDVDQENPSLLRLYGKIGSVPIGREVTYSGKSGTRYTTGDGMIAPILSHELFEEILKDPDPFDICGANW